MSHSTFFDPFQVNNATARVVTKKPQTPLVNSDLSSKTHGFVNGCSHYLTVTDLVLTA